MPYMLWRKAVWTHDWSAAERLMPVESAAQQEAGIAAYRALASGDPAAAQAAARKLMALPDDCCRRLRIELLSQLGHRAEAIALLDRFDAADRPATRQGLPLLGDPALRPLWHDPASEPFLRRNGWFAYWQAKGTKPDLCREARSPSFCQVGRD